jgi:hypothetical protein
MNGNDLIEFEENQAQEIDEAWNKLKGRPLDTEVPDTERNTDEYIRFVDDLWTSHRAGQVDALLKELGLEKQK